MRRDLSGVAALVAAALLVSGPGARAQGPQALVVLPPGEGNTITTDAFARFEASGDCGDLGPNICDQEAAYESWRFRQGPLSAGPDQVPGPVTRESPETGVTIVRDGAGVPHVFAGGPDEQTIEQRLAFGIGVAQAEERPFQMEGLSGVARAVRIFDDLQLTAAPRTPTTVPAGGRALRTSDRLRYRYLRYTPRDTAGLIASIPPSVDAADRALLSGDQATGRATRELGLPVFGSNAWVISPRHSTTGGAPLWGGPQVSYDARPVFDEIEIEGGATHVRGVAVPGGGPGAAIGFTPHTAWTITTAQDDQVDTYVDHIRPAAGGGYEYFWRGSWHPVEQRSETIRVRAQSPSLPGAGSLAPPVYSDHPVTYYRTAH